MGEEDEFGFEEEKVDEEGIYSEEGREELMEEEDEITSVDEGFMEGYEEGKLTAFCANCHRVIKEEFKQEIQGKKYKFCSEECALEFEEKKLSQE